MPIVCLHLHFHTWNTKINRTKPALYTQCKHKATHSLCIPSYLLILWRCMCTCFPSPLWFMFCFANNSSNNAYSNGFWKRLFLFTSFSFRLSRVLVFPLVFSVFHRLLAFSAICCWHFPFMSYFKLSILKLLHFPHTVHWE